MNDDGHNEIPLYFARALTAYCADVVAVVVSMLSAEEKSSAGVVLDVAGAVLVGSEEAVGVVLSIAEAPAEVIVVVPSI